MKQLFFLLISIFIFTSINKSTRDLHDLNLKNTKVIHLGEYSFLEEGVGFFLQISKTSKGVVCGAVWIEDY